MRRVPARSIGPIRTREQLVRLVEATVPSTVCVRAMQAGRVELLGGFSPLPPGPLPGWVLRTTTEHGTVFLTAVLADDKDYLVQRIAEVPWEHWNGDAPGVQETPYAGDNPEEYRELRDARVQHTDHRRTSESS